MTKQRLTYVLERRYKQWLNKGCFMFCKGDINNDWLNKGCFMFCKGDINND